MTLVVASLYTVHIVSIGARHISIWQRTFKYLVTSRKFETF